jgi:quercetin dioxygenase-like cupin family protein
VIIKNYRDVAGETYPGVAGARVRWVITEEDGALNFSLRVIEIESGHSSPRHAHPFEHEVFILEGQGALWSEEGETDLRPGDAAYVPPDEPHQFINKGSATLEMICVIPISQS